MVNFWRKKLALRSNPAPDCSSMCLVREVKVKAVEVRLLDDLTGREEEPSKIDG